MMMPKETWIDLTRGLSEDTPVYPGDEPFKSSDKQIGSFMLKTITTSQHIGTHVDWQRHAIKNGEGIERLPLEQMIGEATKIRVVPKDGVLLTRAIEASYFNACAQEKRLLIETTHGNLYGRDAYFTDFPLFEEDFLTFCVEQGITLIGVDMPSIGGVAVDEHTMHVNLLEKRIALVENLTHLNQLTDHVYFVAAPLKIIGADGSLTRAFAKDLKDFDKT